MNSKDLFVWGSVAGYLLLFIGAPSLILSFLRMQNEEAGIRLSFWKKLLIGVLGGLTGALAAFAVYRPAESSWCRDMYAAGSYCDGQGPFVLILTIPLCSIVGSCISLLWTWYSIRIPAKSPWASVFSYSGESRVLNLGLGVAVQGGYWAVFALAIYLFTRHLL